ncbi:MAG: cell division protein ZapA [Prevotellaceae bacterium]|nr:cell division protein ZapA [Prevotellaceae bacterium]
MDDKIKINLQMAGSSYPLTIDRKDEERVREAAKQVDLRFTAYREYYPEVSPERIMVMVAYQFALEDLKWEGRHDTTPYATKIKELTALLDTCFNDK